MTISNTIVYIFLFFSLYFEVFLLVTYIEKRGHMKNEDSRGKQKPLTYPSVTILVPVWNEQNTVSGTIDSLLKLNYPKDKLKIMIIDDGSTDNTWQTIKTFENNPQVEVYHKENGGKYTALNFGLERVKSELVGCLDADSYVDPDALAHIVMYFDNPEVMSVTPSVKIWKPKTVIQLIQKVEYGWGIFIRKMLSYIGAMYVTPGPFSIFRKTVFDTIGPYRHAHQTEDLEIALRMQKNHYKIENAHNAIVYTVAPSSLKKLYKQRLRWTHGFIKNVVDYRDMIFRADYGNLGMIALPMATISIAAAIYIIGLTLVQFTDSLITEYIKIQAIGFNFHFFNFHLDWFYVNTTFISVISLITFLGTLLLIGISRQMSEGNVRPGRDLLYFLTLYTFIAPLWMIKALYNALLSVKTHWR